MIAPEIVIDNVPSSWQACGWQSGPPVSQIVDFRAGFQHFRAQCRVLIFYAGGVGVHVDEDESAYSSRRTGTSCALSLSKLATFSQLRMGQLPSSLNAHARYGQVITFLLFLHRSTTDDHGADTRYRTRAKPYHDRVPARCFLPMISRVT